MTLLPLLSCIALPAGCPISLSPHETLVACLLKSGKSVEIRFELCTALVTIYDTRWYQQWFAVWWPNSACSTAVAPRLAAVCLGTGWERDRLKKLRACGGPVERERQRSLLAPSGADHVPVTRGDRCLPRGLPRGGRGQAGQHQRLGAPHRPAG